MIEPVYILLSILVVWLVGRSLVPKAIPRSKVKMAIAGFLGGIAGLLVGLIPPLRWGPEVGGASALWTFLGVAGAILWTGLDPLGRSKRRPS